MFNYLGKSSCFIVILCFLSFANNLKSEEDKKFEYFIKKLYQSRLEAVNNPVLALEILSPTIRLQNDILPKSFGLQVFYGFARESSEFYYEDYIYHSHEYAYGSDISTRLTGPTQENKILDLWRFGVGWQNGYAYKFNKTKLYLIHKASFDWNNLHLNYEHSNADIRKTSGELRFGTSFSSGVMLNVIEPFYFGVFYENSLINVRYTFLEHLATFGIENVLQRTPDIFEEELAMEFQNYYPLVYFLYKSAVSYTLYKLKEKNVNFPLKSSNPLVIESFKVDLRFIF